MPVTKKTKNLKKTKRRMRIIIVGKVVQINAMIFVTLSRLNIPESDIECFEDSQKALKFIKETGALDLLITDWDISDKNEGADIIKVARKKSPGCKVVVITNDLEVNRDEITLYRPDLILNKPYNFEEFKFKEFKVAICLIVNDKKAA